MKMTIEEIELILTDLVEQRYHLGDVCGSSSSRIIKRHIDFIECRVRLIQAIKQFETKAFARGYETRDTGKPIARDAENNIYELGERKDDN